MNPVYFNTHFRRQALADWDNRPAALAIITAYPTTGQQWPEARVSAADKELETELRERTNWVRRLTGYDPSTGWAEPGWAAALDFEAACDLGARYQQDAIYYVSGQILYVSYCDHRRALVEVGDFDRRVHEGE